MWYPESRYSYVETQLFYRLLLIDWAWRRAYFSREMADAPTFWRVKCAKSDGRSLLFSQF